MAEYNNRLIDWTNMKEEKQYTFTITENDLKRPSSGPQLKSIKQPNRSISHSEGDLRKYQALPPIRKTPKKYTVVGGRQGVGARENRGREGVRESGEERVAAGSSERVGSERKRGNFLNNA